MCEFKVKNKVDKTQIAEEIVVISYSDDNKLLFKDILGVSEVSESALIYDVNTLNQTCEVIEHPIVNSFINLMKKISEDEVSEKMIDDFEEKLEELRSSIK